MKLYKAAYTHVKPHNPMQLCCCYSLQHTIPILGFEPSIDGGWVAKSDMDLRQLQSNLLRLDKGLQLGWQDHEGQQETGYSPEGATKGFIDYVVVSLSLFASDCMVIVCVACVVCVVCCFCFCGGRGRPCHCRRRSRCCRRHHCRRHRRRHGGGCCLLVCLFVCLFGWLVGWLFASSFVGLFAFASLFVFVSMCVYFVCLLLCLFVCLFACLLVCLIICLPACLAFF